MHIHIAVSVLTALKVSHDYNYNKVDKGFLYEKRQYISKYEITGRCLELATRFNSYRGIEF